MKAQEYIKPIIAAAFTAATAQATLFNLIVEQWNKAKAANVKPSEFRDALVSALTGDDAPHVTTHYSNRASSERVAYSKNTVLKYLRAIDEKAFAQRASAPRPKAVKYSPAQLDNLRQAAIRAHLTKSQITALLDALNA